MHSQSITLTQSLQMALHNNTHNNYFAYALALSRQENPSPETVALTLQLMQSEGLRWGELLERQAIKDYPLVYRYGKDVPSALTALVSVAHYRQNREELNYLTVALFNELEKGSQEAWYPFVRLLKNHLENKSTQTIVALLQAIGQRIANKPSNFLLNLEQFSATLIANQTQEAPLQNFTTSFEIVTVFLHLYRVSKTEHLRHLESLSLSKSSSALLDLFSSYLDNALNYVQHYNENSGGQHRPQTVGYQMATNAIQMLAEASGITELQKALHSGRKRIVEVLFSLNFLQYQGQSTEDQLNYEYCIIEHEKGDDLGSALALTIWQLAGHSPSLLKTMLEYISNSMFLEASEQQLSEYLVKLSVLHKLVTPRKDLAEQYIKPIVTTILNSEVMSTSASLVTNCRKLRLLLYYIQVLEDRIFIYLLTTCFQLLSICPCSSFAFTEADNILQKISDSSFDSDSKSKLKYLIKRDSPFMVKAFVSVVNQTSQKESEGRDEKISRMVKLLRKFIVNNEKEVQKEGAKITGFGCIWLIDQVQRCWARRTKCSPLTFDLVQLLKESIKLVSEDYYLDINEQVYKVLRLLEHSENIDFLDELLQLLAIALEKFQLIDPAMCEILVYLKKIVIDKNHDLRDVLDILQVLNQRVLANRVQEWQDLVPFLLDLYHQYYRTHQLQHRELYQNHYEDVSATFEKFLQTYHPYLAEHPQLLNETLSIVNGMPENEETFRLYLIIHHYYSPSGCNIYGLEQARSCRRRSTMKLTFFYFMDNLLRRFSEEELRNFVEFAKVFKDKQQQRALTSDPIDSFPYEEENTKVYMLEGLKTLRRNRRIDQMDYQILTSQLNLV